MNAVTLETARTILRPFQEEDAADLYEYAHRPDVGPAAGWTPHGSIEESLTVIRTVFSAPYTYAIVEKSSGKMIGSVGFTARTRGGHGTDDEIGYALHPAWWGQGLMTEAVNALIRFGFETRRLDAIWCSHYADNDRSRRVIEKCGFVSVTTERLTDDLGEHSACFYLLLRSQWEGGNHE